MLFGIPLRQRLQILTSFIQDTVQPSDNTHADEEEVLDNLFSKIQQSQMQLAQQAHRSGLDVRLTQVLGGRAPQHQYID